MARPRTFDPEVVLDQAVESFWARGYAGTSIADLEAATGLGRQCLYNTFGDKRALFLASLQRYQQRASRGPLAALAAPDAGLDALSSYLSSMVEFLTPSDERKACFLVNAALEFGEADTDVQSVCSGSADRVSQLIHSALENAVAHGELPSDTHLENATELLTTQVYGLSVRAKHGASRTVLRRAVRTMLAQLQ